MEGEHIMSIIRVNKKSGNYTIMCNEHLKDTKLSLKAVGLLSIMLSLPDDWKYSIDGLCKIRKEQKTSITSTLNELKEYGYVVVTKINPNKENGGKYEYIYDVYESPIYAKEFANRQCMGNQDIENQSIENLYLENLAIENQCLENQPQSITNKLNTNILNTKEENTKDKNLYASIIDYLNEKANRKFKVTEQTKKNINARVREGFKLEDFQYVIDVCILKWTGTEYEDYIQPSTLFNTKFSERRNWAMQNKPKQSSQREIQLPKYMEEQHKAEENKEEHHEQIGIEEIENEVELSNLEERIKRRYQK